MRRRVIIGLGILAVAGALIGAEVLSGGSSGSGAGRPAPPLPTSVLVPPKVSLASLRGRPAAVNFWASWCNPCRKEAPALEQLARSAPDQAKLVGVNWNDGLSSARSYVRQYGWTFPNLRDSSGVVGGRYGLVGLPMTFILDPRGRIVQVLSGPQTLESLRGALRAAAES